MANSRRKAIIKQNRPMASDRANPRMAQENSSCLRPGFLAYPMMRAPKTDPIPAPDPATPTVAAPAPMNLAAESMSALGAEVCMACTVAGRTERMAAMVRRGETARRAMADMMIGGGGYRLVYRSYDGETVMEGLDSWLKLPQTGAVGEPPTSARIRV